MDICCWVAARYLLAAAFLAGLLEHAFRLLVCAPHVSSNDNIACLLLICSFPLLRLPRDPTVSANIPPSLLYEARIYPHIHRILLKPPSCLS